MRLFSTLDIVALGFFIVAWGGYALMNERSRWSRSGLNALMDGYRVTWMRRMLEREQRMVDMQIMAALQNGTAFFASTSLLAVGGALALFRSTEDMLKVLAILPLGIETSRILWEVKVVGLAVILVYAFFKFAWSYRIFNYAAILLGAVPRPDEVGEQEARAAAHRAAAMNVVAGRHFNRGQRAFLFALAYLGWFVSPYIFVGATAACLLVMWRRQFASDAIAALKD